MTRFSVVFQFETETPPASPNSLDLASNGRIDSYEVSGTRARYGTGSRQRAWRSPNHRLHGAIIHLPPSPAPPMAIAAVIPITRYLAWEAAFQRHKHNYS